MAKADKSAKYYGTGRRKKSIARVYLVPGKGEMGAMMHTGAAVASMM